MDNGMTAQGGNRRRIQLRKPMPRTFDAAKRQVFLDHLAGCSNMMRAAAAAGVSPSTVSDHRRRDEVFAAQIAEALEAGYEALEAAVMERAATGGGYVPGPDAATAPAPESVDTALALRLLSLRNTAGKVRTKKVGRPAQRVTDTELNTVILAKLEVLDRRLQAGRPLGFKGRKGTRA